MKKRAKILLKKAPKPLAFPFGKCYSDGGFFYPKAAARSAAYLASKNNPCQRVPHMKICVAKRSGSSNEEMVWVSRCCSKKYDGFFAMLLYAVLLYRSNGG
jgi:hypothetical protein